jgi:hypothetical protein
MLQYDVGCATLPMLGLAWPTRLDQLNPESPKEKYKVVVVATFFPRAFQVFSKIDI